jgi:hypothetical protein
MGSSIIKLGENRRERERLLPLNWRLRPYNTHTRAAAASAAARGDKKRGKTHLGRYLNGKSKVYLFKSLRDIGVDIATLSVTN